MKKIIITIIVLALVLITVSATLASYGYDIFLPLRFALYYNQLPLDEQIMINVYRFENNVEYPYIATLYKKCENGAIIANMENMFSHERTCAIGREKVAGYVFKFSTSDRINVYYHGRMYGFNEAYEHGIVTQNDVLDAYTIHYQMMPYLKEELIAEETYEDRLEKQLKERYEQYYSELDESDKYIVDLYNNGSIENMGCIIDHYCELENGSIVVSMSSLSRLALSSVEVKKEIIADMTFEFSTLSGSIKVLFEGKIYSLAEAYEIGLVSYDELKEIHSKHNTSEWWDH